MSPISNVCLLTVIKITKGRRRSKYDLTNIDFDNIVIEDVKYLLFALDGDVIFNIQLVNVKLQMLMTRQWMAWTRFLIGMFGAKPNQQAIKMNWSSIGHPLVISNAQMIRVNIFCKVVEIAIASNELVFHQLLLWLVKAFLRNIGLNGRFFVSLPYVL